MTILKPRPKPRFKTDVAPRPRSRLETDVKTETE